MKVRKTKMHLLFGLDHHHLKKKEAVVTILPLYAFLGATSWSKRIDDDRSPQLASLCSVFAEHRYKL